MSKQKKGLEPALRFPEFQGQTSWMRFKLIDVADKNVKWSFIGGPFGSNLKASDYLKKGIRIIQLQNIGDGQFNDDYRVFTSKEKADELLANNIYPGDIIISKMGDPVGRACIIPETNNRYVMCSDGIRLVVDEERHSKYFIYSIINYSQFRKIIEISATGSTRKRIGLAELKKLPMFLPVKKEQQKIADCLRSIDELIIANTNKCESFKLHKQGLMQKLFPTEGRDVPELRLVGFDKSWETKKFSTYIKLFRGSSPRPISEYITKSNCGVNWIKIGDTSQISDFIIRSVSQRITPDGASKSRYVKKGELILANSMSYGSTYQLDIDGYIYDGWFVLREYEDFFDKQYLLQVLNSNYIQDQYKKLAAGGIVQNISSDIVNSVVVPKPTIEEQKKIADILNSIDELIKFESVKIETLKNYKLGLMQRLFPSFKELAI
ncbi:restriction endonuclease subunit S [Vibrio cholerae]|uniref:restriction endonuclease subunit S n=1 Tax=Vibrio cholerae TaxID=666 RepID=UPI000E0A02BF|nr:restriction endonuclease subunit S [Vibrio cholerae]EJB8348341.1 restriction endonuclease subunit S [Vibrio cholerae]EJB8377666.1 restriction endonuclease subunit S [Vibrio cholerae]TQP90872.1 restriction endonuclease subunit S [Vibrio cholerae]TXY37483.1 restriction endonuclease subunit S [Vibrio cholerae]GIB71902.1 Type I site-specific deoxyribonuclease [Vibrio cholerae]